MNDYYDCDSGKPEVNMLPSSSRTKGLYWIMTALFIAVWLIRMYIHYQIKYQIKSNPFLYNSFESNPYTDFGNLSVCLIILSLGAAVSGLALIGLFANACRQLRHHESTYIYALMLVPILLPLNTLNRLLNGNEEKIIISLIIFLLYIVCGVLAFMLSKALRKYYSGALNELGTSILGLVEIVFFTVVALILVMLLTFVSGNDSAIDYVAIISVCIGLYILYRYFAVLWQMSELMDAGNENGLTDREFERILRCHGVSGSIETDPQDTGSTQLAFKTLELRNKWHQLSSTAKVVIFAVIALVCAGCVWLMTRNNEGQELQDDETPEWIGTVYTENEYDTSGNGDSYDNTESVYQEGQTEISRLCDRASSDIPAWVPDNIRENLVADGYIYNGVGTCEWYIPDVWIGSINDSPIKMKLHYEDSDGSITGRYAYQTTLRKYGDGESSWYKLKGAIFFTEDEYLRIVMRSYAPKTDEVFEYFNLTSKDEIELNGTMFNARYLEQPTAKLFEVHLKNTEMAPD